MAYDAQFKRDSPPGSVQEETEGIARHSGNRGATFHQHEEDSCEERKEQNTHKRAVPNRNFSSKLELDANLDTMFELVTSNYASMDHPLTSKNVEDMPEEVEGEEKDGDIDEFKLVRHFMEPLSQTHFDSQDVGVKAKSKKKERRKRGASLERMIAKLILQSSKPEPILSRCQGYA
jgi:hypothetical protein